MKFACRTSSPADPTVDCLIVGVFTEHRLSPHAEALNKKHGRLITQLIKQRDILGELGQTLLLPAFPSPTIQRVLLVGCGKPEEFTEEAYTAAIENAINALRNTGAKQAECTLIELPVGAQSLFWKIRQATLTIAQKCYQFNTLKNYPKPPAITLQKVTFPLKSKPDLVIGKKAIEEGCAMSEGITLTKDLANLPANICTPTYLAQQAKKMSTQSKNITVTIVDEKAMKKLKMGALLAVAQGSREPPKLVVIHYQGARKSAKPIVLVGKGVTFDSGGISIKPPAAMDEMKYDMCGAACVFGTLQAIAQLKLPVNVIGIMPCVENLPGGNAFKPGDIVTSMSGQTIEVLNTDAEGRLILADAITYSRRFNPAVVIDIATLTGSMVIALGEHLAGLFTENDTLAKDLLKAGEISLDPLWRMPLKKVYQAQLQSPFADLANIGGRYGGSITAACFLARFTENLTWAHLDVAGVAYKSGEGKGATGRPVKLLTQYILDYITQQS